MKRALTSANGVVGQVGDSNIAFNNSPAAVTNNLDGVVTITGNTFSRGYYHGIQIYNTTGMIDNATISSNTYANSTSAAAAQG